MSIFNISEVLFIPYDGSRDQESFIAKSWKDSLLDFCESKWIPKGLFYAHYNEKIDALILKSKIVFAVNPSDNGHLLGWACGQDNALHFVYVKKQFRSIGIGRKLIASVVDFDCRRVTATHTTDKHYDNGLVINYRPSIAYEQIKKAQDDNKDQRG